MPWLALLLSLQQALWIDVPYVRQDKNGCGSASLWMILEYWKSGSAPPVEEIQDQLYSEDAGGIFARDMEKYLRSRSYSAFAFRGEWPDFEEQIGKGRPLIVSLEQSARGAGLHYVVVAGIDSARNLILINDPASRKLLSMDRATFERRWKAVGNWTLLAVPELELAGAAFREENLRATKEHLTSALRSDPSDAHTNEFLATVHFIQNNTESALKYWNRAGKPLLENIHVDPPLQIDPVILDRAFAFSRGSVLTLADFRTTQARLDAMELFSRHHMELTPHESSGRFDVTLRAAERNGTQLLSWLRGLPYQTMYPEWFNAGGNAINLKSLVRWDSDKRRAYFSLSSPVAGEPKHRIRVSLDGRDEHWQDSTDTFRMRKVEAALEFQSIPNGRWNWSSGAAVSNRQSTFGLKYTASLTRALIRDSDRRFNLESSLSVGAGKLFTPDSQRFGRLDTRVSATWRPPRDRDDLELAAAWRMGRTVGEIPFDEQFVIGVDRDSDLWLRGHPASAGGMKTTASLARSFVLGNFDFQKVVADSGLIWWSAGPFLDVGHTSSWILDTGIQLRFTALGNITFNLSYGKSLRDARHAIFIH